MTSETLCAGEIHEGSKGSNKLRLNKIQKNRAIKITDKCYNAK
jgi:hypothetical protein